MKAQPPLTDEQIQIIRDIVLNCLKGAPDQISARLGEDTVLIAGIALGVVLLNAADDESAWEVIPMAICPKIEPEQREGLARMICGDVGHALLEASENGGGMSAREIMPVVLGLGSTVKGRA